MSFYAHPFQRRQAPASHAAHYPFATAPGVTTSPSFNFFTAPHSPAPAPAPASTPDYAFYDTIDAEEQAALAHLRSIQQRREAAQAAARREAALQAHLAARQEAAYAALVERHLIEQRQKQQQQEAAARAIAFEQHRRAQIAAAQTEIVQREVARRELAQREFARRAIAIEQRKAAEEEWIKKRNACARRCAGGCANVKKNDEKAQEEDKEEHDEWKEMNEVLASLFGFNFAQPQEAKKEKVSAPVAKPEVKAERKPADKVEQPAPAAPKPADAKPASPKPESTDAPKPAQLDLNDLLSTFLGMSLEPAKADDKPTENADQLTAKLNDFLSQFGLEFESIDSVEKSTKAESSSAAAAQNEPASTTAKADAPAPTTTAAPTPADKGKSVAEGERPTRSTETTAAFNKLRDISHELHLATESFTFPSKLSFADTASSDATPALLFNKGNSGYHAQAHKLLQLLLAADGISSGGDREVRKQRKAIVKAIEGAIEQLENKRDEVWREVKEKREMGGEVSDDESVSSWNSTEVEHVENANGQEQDKDEEVKEKTEQTTYAEAAAGGTEDKPEEQPEVKAEETEVKGFEVPGEESSGTETTVKATPETDTKEAREEKKANVKEDEFELL